MEKERIKSTKRWLLEGLIFTVFFNCIYGVFYWLVRDDFYFVALIGMVLCIFFGFPKKHSANPDSFIFRASPEIFIVVCLIGLTYYNGVFTLLRVILDWDEFEQPMPALISQILEVFIFSLVFWYVATMIELIFHVYKKEFFTRSLIFRAIKNTNDYIEKRRQAYVSGMLSDEECKRLKRIIVGNAFILAAISVFWVFGWGFLAIYAVYIYRLVKKSISEMREGYNNLSDALRNICEGNYNFDEEKNLGVYEDLKHYLVDISNGMSSAVTKEVKSERMKMELVSNVSHDLKTPLTAMITYIDLLKDEKDEEKRKEYLDIISKRSDRLKLLIEDLFEVTKATTGNIKLDPVKMDIVNLVKQVLIEYEERFKSSELEVVSEYPNGRVDVYADSQKTYRIFANLFGNAAKYSLIGSRLYVEIKETENEAITIIKNISATKLNLKGEDLTERFVRGDSSRNTEGSGLGLAIAKSFAEAQGGSLDIVVDGDLFKAVVILKK